MSRPSVADTEEEWTEKIFNECEDEFYESFGVYDGKTSMCFCFCFFYLWFVIPFK